MTHLTRFKYQLKRRGVYVVCGVLLYTGLGWVTPKIYSMYFHNTVQSKVISQLPEPSPTGVTLGIETQMEVEDATSSADQSQE